MSDTMYTYIIVRTDIPTAQQIVQAAHAAHNAGHRFGTHSHMVVAGASDQQTLLKHASFLEANGVAHELFHEPDDNVGYTALCTEPLVNDRRRVMKRFSLLKH